MTLGIMAIMLEEEPLLAEALRNPTLVQALIDNPDVVLFYPWYVNSVPDYLKGRLPQMVLRSTANWGVTAGEILESKEEYRD